MDINLDQYEEILTPEEVATILRFSTTAIYKMIESGEIQGVKIGNSWRIPKQGILDLLNPKKQTTRKTEALTTAPKGESVQDLVRAQIHKFLENPNTPEESIENLQDKDFCKKTFGINFPLLLKFDPKKPRKTQGLDSHGYQRYWRKVFPRDFLVCSQQYQRNKDSFKEWFSKQGL